MTTAITCPVCDVPFNHDGIHELPDGRLVVPCANGHRFDCAGFRTYRDKPDEYDLRGQILDTPE